MRWQVESLSAGSAEITAAVADPESYASGEVEPVRTSFLSIGRHIASGSDLSGYPAYRAQARSLPSRLTAMA